MGASLNLVDPQFSQVLMALLGVLSLEERRLAYHGALQGLELTPVIVRSTLVDMCWLRG